MFAINTKIHEKSVRTPRGVDVKELEKSLARVLDDAKKNPDPWEVSVPDVKSPARRIKIVVRTAGTGGGGGGNTMPPPPQTAAAPLVASLPAGTRMRHWCFTSWKLDGYLSGNEIKDCRYMVWQFEKTQGGKVHRQGYIEFGMSGGGPSIKKMKELFEEHDIHVEPRRGTRDQARDYCMDVKKRVSGTEPVEYGVWEAGGQGKRNDIKEMMDKIKEGVAIKEIAREYQGSFMRTYRGLERYKAMEDEDRASEFRKLKVVVEKGPPGTGKSMKWLYNDDGKFNRDVFVMNAQDKRQSIWWDGYAGQKTILMDDYDGWMGYNELLTFLGGHKYRMNVKGGHTWCMATTVVFTTNTFIEQWYPTRDEFGALRRRVNECIGDPWELAN